MEVNFVASLTGLKFSDSDVHDLHYALIRYMSVAINVTELDTYYFQVFFG